MSVTDTKGNTPYENKNCNGILSENHKNFKKKKNPKTFLCNRIIITVALEAYLEPSETSMIELLCEEFTI